MEKRIANIKDLADDLLMRVSSGQADWDSVEDVLESIIDLCSE